MTAQLSASQVVPVAQRSLSNIFAPVQRELDRVFDQIGNGWNAFAEMGMNPRMDLVETGSKVELTFELPGMTQADVDVSIDGDMLKVTGEKKAEKDSKGRNGRIMERSYGAFERMVRLPDSIDPAKVKATIANGVLTVTVAKQAGAPPRRIEVKSPTT